MLRFKLILYVNKSYCICHHFIQISMLGCQTSISSSSKLLDQRGKDKYTFVLVNLVNLLTTDCRALDIVDSPAEVNNYPKMRKIQTKVASTLHFYMGSANLARSRILLARFVLQTTAKSFYHFVCERQ